MESNILCMTFETDPIFQGYLYMALLHNHPWENEPKRPADVHTPPPKMVFIPYKVGWRLGKPSGMNKGYVLPPLDSCLFQQPAI